MKYPEIYIDPKISEILDEKPPLPIKPQKPSEPKKPVNPGEYDSGGNRGCFGFMLAGSIIGIFAIIAAEDLENKGTLILIAIVLMFLSLFLFKTTSWDKSSHEEKQKQYLEDIKTFDVRLSQYQTALSKYEKDISDYNSEIKSILSSTNIKKYRRKKILSYLQNRSIPDIEDCDADDNIKTGASELYFYEYLKSLGFDVCINKKIRVGKQFYYPDFLIFFQKYGN